MHNILYKHRKSIYKLKYLMARKTFYRYRCKELDKEFFRLQLRICKNHLSSTPLPGAVGFLKIDISRVRRLRDSRDTCPLSCFYAGSPFESPRAKVCQLTTH